MDIVGIIDNIKINGKNKILKLKSGSFDKQYYVNLILWDRFLDLPFKLNQIIIAQGVLFKKYKDEYEVNTTKSKTVIYFNI